MPTTSTTSSQIKVTLPDELRQFAQSRADKFGLTLSTYIKHLVLDDVKDIDMPTFPMSSKTEGTLLQELREYKLKKTHALEKDEIDEFLEGL